jgi:Xaa-Pro aminopeptidase
MEYLSGFRAPDPVVLLRAAGRCHLVVPTLELSRARRVAGHMTVLCPEDLGLRGAARRRLANWALRLLQREKVSRVRVPGSFPYGIGRRLERAGIRVQASRGELLPDRAVKTAEEVRKITASQQAAVLAMRAAIGLIEGATVDEQGGLWLRGRRLTSESLRRFIALQLLRHDCFCRDVIVAGGEQGADPHERGHGPLWARQTVVLDIFPRHLQHGYWGDLTRTVARGPVPPGVRRMYQAVKAAQAAALSVVRAGARCGGVHRAAVEEFRRRGYGTGRSGEGAPSFLHGTGHGVGLEVHEEPSLAQAGGRLRAGNVVTVEPGLYWPGVGGVRIEDTVVVTGSGWKYLVPCEKRFELQ